MFRNWVRARTGRKEERKGENWRFMYKSPLVFTEKFFSVRINLPVSLSYMIDAGEAFLCWNCETLCVGALRHCVETTLVHLMGVVGRVRQTAVPKDWRSE